MSAEGGTGGAPTGRPLRDILDRIDREPPTADVIEQTLQQIDQRRARGARFLSDITADERGAMERHRANQADPEG